MLVDEYVKVLSIFVEIFVDLEFLIVFCIVMVLCSVIGYLEFDRNFLGWYCWRLIRISRGV